MTLRHTTQVLSLGSQGDGFTLVNTKPVYVPFTVPGDTISVPIERPTSIEDIDVVEASPQRIEPVCSLFGRCGGCSLQMIQHEALLAWKVEQVTQALSKAGFESIPHPSCYQVAPLTRRRIDLAAQRAPGRMILGLHRRRGDVVDMNECHVLDPQIFSLLTPLRSVLSSLGAITTRSDVHINLLQSGADILLRTDSELSISDRSKLATFARSYKIPRLSWQSRISSKRLTETVAQIDRVYQHFGALTVTPPPGGFIQATEEAEAKISDTVCRVLPRLNRHDTIVELYAGCGTLSGRLAAYGRVIAYEGNDASCQALHAGKAGMRIEARHRDLSRQPLLSKDFDKARVVVVDPPYGGMGPQMSHLAASNVKDIIYVSCNPVSLGEDVTLLQRRGYAIYSVSVIDQFLWSSEVETVVCFSKDKKRFK